jgi:hypothetical protein
LDHPANVSLASIVLSLFRLARIFSIGVFVKYSGDFSDNLVAPEKSVIQSFLAIS